MSKWCDDWALGFDQRRRDADQARAREAIIAKGKPDPAKLPTSRRVK